MRAIIAHGLAGLHDFGTGEPFRYRLNADGTYLLYAAGLDGQAVGLRCSTQMETVRDTTTTLFGKVARDELNWKHSSVLVFVSAKVVPADGVTAVR